MQNLKEKKEQKKPYPDCWPMVRITWMDAMDGDTGQWFPTKSGFALPADEVCSLLPLLEDAAKEVSKRFVYSTQIEFEFGEINER